LLNNGSGLLKAITHWGGVFIYIKLGILSLCTRSITVLVPGLSGLLMDK